ncbi:hypothetical protein L6164_009644 [Bauhinia variegata]|uniref:Uncharacterized protein n=1 Tax=Bauhinia variegata TaxID=167791 RepID=A0ACB9PM03_BAUVA|nr:hypothetical protein L6164_009644 [Bauhinia variegata]
MPRGSSRVPNFQVIKFLSIAIYLFARTLFLTFTSYWVKFLRIKEHKKSLNAGLLGFNFSCVSWALPWVVVGFNRMSLVHRP